jgi:hypothetical protein
LEYWRTNFLKILLAALIITTVLSRLATTVADADLWGYLAFGRLFWHSGHFPYNDPFSFVPTLHPWVYHEWLTGVIFYPLYQAGGAVGLQLLKYALVLGTLGLVYLTARKRGAGPLAAVLGIFLIHNLFRLGYSPVRAQAFTYFFFALTFYLLESSRLSRNYGRLWLLPPLMVVWCNLHAGFLAGLGLIGLFALGATLSRRPSRPYWLLLLLSTAVALINPYGYKYLGYLVHAVNMPRPQITEWASVYQSYISGANRSPLLYFLLLNVFTGLWWFRSREITAGLALALTAYLGWMHLRHQVFFLIICGAYLPGLLSVYLEDLRSRPRLRNFWRRLDWRIPATLAVLLTIFNGYRFLQESPLTLKLPPLPRAQSESPFYYPLGAMAYLRRHALSGKILVNFDWGEYLIWDLYPQCRVALDGRFETVYPAAVAQKYFAFIYAQDNWRQFLRDYPPDLILIDSRSQTYLLLLKEPHWQRLYLDAGSALFRRRQ